MLKMIKKLFSHLRKCSNGNAIVLVAAGMPALIGSAGFAVDTAQWYMWKRELQHAVDQAAYAGAWARANPNSESTYKTRAQQEYDVNVAIVESFDVTPSISLVSYGNGSNNSVLVSSSATRLLPFTSFITGKAATISVKAQATFRRGADYSACLIALREDDTALSIGGNATIRARCGLAALSCDEDAIVIDGSAKVVTDSIAACGKISSFDPNHNEIIAEDIAGLKDIYADLEPPTNDTSRNYQCTGSGKNRQATLQPGTYQGLTISCNTVFSSGIYVIDGGVLDLTHNSSVIGNGVMFVLRNGAALKLGGMGNANAINLTPMTAADLAGTPYASMADDFAGILIFEDRDNDPNQSHVLNGNSNSLVEGLIYLPAGDLQINGTADVAAQCLQISAYTIDVRGGAVLETLCPVDQTTKAGSGLADVRLVA